MMSAWSRAVGRGAIPLIFQVCFSLTAHCLLGGETKKENRKLKIVSVLLLLFSFPEELSWNFRLLFYLIFLSKQTECCCYLYFRFWFAWGAIPVMGLYFNLFIYLFIKVLIFPEVPFPWHLVADHGKGGSVSNKGKDKSSQNGTGAKSFTFQQLINATRSFKVMIGEGGFGKVYKGKLENGQASCFTWLGIHGSVWFSGKNEGKGREGKCLKVFFIKEQNRGFFSLHFPCPHISLLEDLNWKLITEIECCKMQICYKIGEFFSLHMSSKWWISYYMPCLCMLDCWMLTRLIIFLLWVH